MATGEYRNLLDSGSYPAPEKDFWGYRAEFSAFEIVSVRWGGGFMPPSSIDGKKREPMPRDGAGVNCPLEKSDGACRFLLRATTR